jgi:hypothetical protein
MRGEVDDAAEREQTHAELDDTHHQGQQQHHADEFVAHGYGQRGHGSGGHERDDRHRAGGQLPRRPPENTEDGRHQGGIETEMNRQPGQLRIGHGLRHQHQRTGDPGDQVAAQNDGIDGKPGEERKETQQQLVVEHRIQLHDFFALFEQNPAGLTRLMQFAL